MTPHIPRLIASAGLAALSVFAPRTRRCGVGRTNGLAILFALLGAGSLASCGGGSGGATPSSPGSAVSPTSSPPKTLPAGSYSGYCTNCASPGPRLFGLTNGADTTVFLSWMPRETRLANVHVGGPDSFNVYAPCNDCLAGQLATSHDKSLRITVTADASEQGFRATARLGDFYDFFLNKDWGLASGTSLDLARGVYTATDPAGSGYVLTLTSDPNGMLYGSDTRGCVLTGQLSAPRSSDNLFALSVAVTSCGTSDGTYLGLVALRFASDDTVAGMVLVATNSSGAIAKVLTR